MPTKFRFASSDDYDLKDKVKELSKPVKEYEPVFMMNIVWYENTAVLMQRVKMKTPEAIIHGTVEYMVC